MIFLLLLILLIPAPLWAAIGHQDQNTASGDSNTPGTTLAITVSDTMIVGRIGLLRIASDNVGTGDANYNEHTSVTDTVGNTYNKLCEATNGQGSAGAGITGSLWLVRITIELTAGQTVNITFASSVTARAAQMNMWSVTAGNTLAMAAGSGGCNSLRYDGTSVSTSATTAVASAETLWFRAIFNEGGSMTITPTAGFTAMAFESSSGASDTDNAAVHGEWRISTNTFETSAPTASDTNDDLVTMFLALREVSATPTTRRRASPVEIN